MNDDTGVQIQHDRRKWVGLALAERKALKWLRCLDSLLAFRILMSWSSKRALISYFDKM